MKLTPDLLASAYSMLRETAPFDGWDLPDADDVRFRVLKTTRLYGDAVATLRGRTRVAENWQIRLSEGKHSRLSGVLETMAHEMVHVHLREIGCHSDSSHHGPAFQACAKQVTDAHPEFDPVIF